MFLLGRPIFRVRMLQPGSWIARAFGKRCGHAWCACPVPTTSYNYCCLMFVFGGIIVVTTFNRHHVCFSVYPCFWSAGNLELQMLCLIPLIYLIQKWNSHQKTSKNNVFCGQLLQTDPTSAMGFERKQVPWQGHLQVISLFSLCQWHVI